MLCYPPPPSRSFAGQRRVPPASGNARTLAHGQKATSAELWLPAGLAWQQWPAWGWGGRPSLLLLRGSVPAQRWRLAPCAGWGPACLSLSVPLNKTSPLQSKPKAFCSLGRPGDRSCLPLERDWVCSGGCQEEDFILAALLGFTSQQSWPGALLTSGSSARRHVGQHHPGFPLGNSLPAIVLGSMPVCSAQPSSS